MLPCRRTSVPDLTILSNARIFTSVPGEDDLVEGAIVISHGNIDFVGVLDAAQVISAREAGAVEIDLRGRIVSSGFIEAHGHLLDFAQALSKCSLVAAKSWSDIRYSIATFAKANPATPRLVFKHWLQSSISCQPLRTMLDDIDERPIYVEAMDLHSVWCSTSALIETGIMFMSEDPEGGKIHRGRDGRPSGLLEEGAMFEYVVPFIFRKMMMEDRISILRQAISHYTSSGYTGFVDMLMDDEQWVTLETYRQRHELPLNIAAYWIIHYGSDDYIQKQLNTALAMNKRYHPHISPAFCIVGIKLIGDGTVEGCTAGLSRPYESSSNLCDPIWPAEQLENIVRQADEAKLQVAIHAIGDQTITNAVNAIAALGPARSGRHRIEHLELTSQEHAWHLGQFGIVASVQPVHSDPVFFRPWPELIGAERCKRAFAYQDFLLYGAPLAFGTDAPTATHLPLSNMYCASTRRSVLEPESEDLTNAHFKVTLAEAVRACTYGAAYSREAEHWCGSLRPGLSADLVVWESEWQPRTLLSGRICQTWFRGVKVFDVDEL